MGLIPDPKLFDVMALYPRVFCDSDVCAWPAELTEIGSTVREKVLGKSCVEVVAYDLTLDYNYWSVEHILKVEVCSEPHM